MTCVDCGGELGPGLHSACIRISPSGSAGICTKCVKRYGPAVALDIRLDEAISTAAHDAPSHMERRQG